MNVKLIATRTTRFRKKDTPFTKPKGYARAMVALRLARYDDSVQEEVAQLSEQIQDEIKTPQPERKKRAYKRRDVKADESGKRKYARRDMTAEDSDE